MTDRPPIHLRQWPIIEHISRRVEAMDEYLGALLIGSFAAGTADTLSDVDLFLVVRESGFDQAWARRRELGFKDDVYAWDWRLPAAPEIGTHRFVTSGLVYVECLLATPSSGRTVGRAVLSTCRAQVSAQPSPTSPARPAR
jgi:hypothetical protein